MHISSRSILLFLFPLTRSLRLPRPDEYYDASINGGEVPFQSDIGSSRLGPLERPQLPLSVPDRPTRLPQPTPVPGKDVSILIPKEVATWVDPAQYASAAYCPSQYITDWNCGPACDSLSRPKDIIVGGDGGLQPRFYIATISPDTILISISGTNATNDISILIDLDILLVPPDEEFFPGATGNGVLVSKGYHEAFQRIRALISATVLDRVGRGVSRVMVVGHSMGAVLGQFIATHLQLLVGPDVIVSVRGFGPPRSGNEQWAEYVDATLGARNQFMINYADHVPHLPPRIWTFKQASGEIWGMEDRETYWRCEGQENESCSVSLETPGNEMALWKSFIHLLGLPEHLGPYAGVTISDTECPL